MKNEDTRLAHARECGQATFEHIKELVERLQSLELGNFDVREEVEQEIHEMPLSVEVRSDWYTPGECLGQTSPVEFRILLSTGGPAIQLRGTLSEHGEPEKAWLEVQDWFTPWTEFWPVRPKDDDHRSLTEDILLRFARCFYFGE